MFESRLLGKLCEQTYLQGIKMTPLGILVLNTKINSIFIEKVAIFVSHAPPPFSRNDQNLVNMGAFHIVSGHIGTANTNGGV